MDEKDLEQIKKIALGPKKTQSEAGSVEELDDAIKLLYKLDRENAGPQLNRIGFYGRFNL